MTRKAEAGSVLVFDSGIGGLSVVRAIRAELPRAELVYVADDAAFPYGDWEETALTAHIVELMGDLIAEHRPAAAVIACNTASTLVLPALRARHAIPFVGTVPAIKPAAEATQSGIVAVLATPGTMARDYTRDLIRRFASLVHVRLVGAPDLARLAEAHLRGEAVERAIIAEQIAPCFVELEGRRTDIVVLACTHYPFLAGLFAELAPWPVTYLNPAPAIARRLGEVLQAGPVKEGEGRALFTSGRAPPAQLRAALAAQGLKADAATADGAP
ncbi:glutamate racemase [Afifella pfennigii]|uniref:glutamate racemase n=1 Tax=Afifella pfennigii TaxID=209897 RepID=UPI0005501E09